MLCASVQNNQTIVTDLLRVGANPNVCSEVEFQLHVFFLLSQVVLVQAGHTPLFLAVLNNNTVMVGELIQARVDVNHLNEVSDVSYYCPWQMHRELNLGGLGFKSLVCMCDSLLLRVMYRSVIVACMCVHVHAGDFTFTFVHVHGHCYCVKRTNVCSVVS